MLPQTPDTRGLLTLSIGLLKETLSNLKLTTKSALTLTCFQTKETSAICSIPKNTGVSPASCVVDKIHGRRGHFRDQKGRTTTAASEVPAITYCSHHIKNENLKLGVATV